MKTSGRKEIKSRELPRTEPLKTSQKMPSIKIKAFHKDFELRAGDFCPVPFSSSCIWVPKEAEEGFAPCVSQDCNCKVTGQTS